LNGGEGESFIAAAQLQPITAMESDANVDLAKSDEFGSATTMMSNKTSGGNMAGRISSTSYSRLLKVSPTTRRINVTVMFFFLLDSFPLIPFFLLDSFPLIPFFLLDSFPLIPFFLLDSFPLIPFFSLVWR
jgi:hypothetical protein